MIGIDFFYPRWGSEAMDWHDFAHRVRQHGFAGVEVFPLASKHEREDMLAALANEGLSCILMQAEFTEGKSFGKYLAALEHNLYELLEYRTPYSRIEFIVSQTGREYYTLAQMEKCFELCERIAQESSIEIVHETHRNKWSFAAHVVNDYLLQFPWLRLALDISHWVCVSESFLEDQQEAVTLAIHHTKHLHARIGHPQGPQVTDPRAGENAGALEHHLRWWDMWISHLKDNGTSRATITPEFGPYPYMAYKPFTAEPVSNQWEINLWMKEKLRARYC